MARVLALPDQDKYMVFENLRFYFRDVFSGEAQVTKALQDRADTLEALRSVVKHLGLKPDEKPTTETFDSAATAIGIDCRSGQVIRAWGRWRNATNALVGSWTPPTPAQRSLNRKFNHSGKKRTSEDYLAGIRLWLDSDPIRLHQTDYNEFALRYNDQLGDEKRLLVAASTIVAAFPLTWKQIIRVAEKSLEPSVAKSEAYVLEVGDNGPLIGIRGVAMLLDKSPGSISRWIAKEGFPATVARLNNGRAWYRTDIEKYRDGDPFPARVEMGEQDDFLSREEVAEAVGLEPGNVRRMIFQERWRMLPRPEGRIGRSHYWIREKVERWLKERETE